MSTRNCNLHAIALFKLKSRAAHTYLNLEPWKVQFSSEKRQCIDRGILYCLQNMAVQVQTEVKQRVGDDVALMIG